MKHHDGEPGTQMTVSTAQAPIDHRARQIDGAGASLIDLLERTATKEQCLAWMRQLWSEHMAVIEALEEAEQFVDRHSEPWYRSGQELLSKIRVVLTTHQRPASGG